jgi:hypothetical protein
MIKKYISINIVEEEIQNRNNKQRKIKNIREESDV